MVNFNIIKTIAKILPWDVNPRVIEFGCHYLSGAQTEKTLLPEEVEVTKGQILRSLACAQCRPNEAHLNQLVDEEYDEDNPQDKAMEGWFSHPTMGLVGGFNFDLRVEEDGIYADCVDTWDFNYSTAVLKVPLNKTLIFLAESCLRTLEIPYEVDGTTIYIQECWLEHLNASRAFKTRWSVKLATLQEAASLPVRFAVSRRYRRGTFIEYSLLEYSNLD